MPYADPEKRRQAHRESDRRRRARERAARVEAARGPNGELPDPPDHDELLKLLGVAARAGDVRAIRLLLEFDEADGDDDDVGGDPFAAVDELSPRRRLFPLDDEDLPA